MAKVGLLNGDVYRSDAGPDNKIGHVDLESGKVYSRRLGPDKKIERQDRAATSRTYVNCPLIYAGLY